MMLPIEQQQHQPQQNNQQQHQRVVTFNDDATQIHVLRPRSTKDKRRRWYGLREANSFAVDVRDTLIMFQTDDGSSKRIDNDETRCLRGLEGLGTYMKMDNLYTKKLARQRFVRTILEEQAKHKTSSPSLPDDDCRIALRKLSIVNSQSYVTQALELALEDAKDAAHCYEACISNGVSVESKPYNNNADNNQGNTTIVVEPNLCIVVHDDFSTLKASPYPPKVGARRGVTADTILDLKTKGTPKLIPKIESASMA